MKSVGEAMAIGRTFKEGLQKCLRSPAGAASAVTWLHDEPATNPVAGS